MKKFFSEVGKKLFRLILYVFLCVPMTLLIILWVIGLILYTPIDYIKYKCSLFYKKERKKYSWFITRNINFIFYNEILKNNLPIEFFHHSRSSHLGKRGWLEDGWFVYDGTLIMLNEIYYFRFNSDKGEWICDVRKYGEKDDYDDCEDFTIDALIESEIEQVNKTLGKTVCDKAVFLTNRRRVDNIELAKNEPRFLIYDKNVAEVLFDFCATK